MAEQSNNKIIPICSHFAVNTPLTVAKMPIFQGFKRFLVLFPLLTFTPLWVLKPHKYYVFVWFYVLISIVSPYSTKKLQSFLQSVKSANNEWKINHPHTCKLYHISWYFASFLFICFLNVL